MPNDHLSIWETISTGHSESIVAHVSRSDIGTGLGDALWVCDSNTHSFLPDSVNPSRCVVVPAGESSKDWPQVASILDAALSLGLDRGATIVALGGGVICDLAAFAASVYLRGIRTVLVPTTLLAMVDAAVGGKTGINYHGYKNMVGTFHTAAEVRVCEDYLSTLSQREFYSGLAEAIKAAVIDDEALLHTFEEKSSAISAREPAVMLDICRRAIRVKANIVREDYREKGRRAFLNLGHTFAHALETVAGFGVWTHGAAVAWGMAQAMLLGREAGVTPDAHARRVVSVLEQYDYPTGACGESSVELISAMAQDKKRHDGEIRFVLSRGVGDTVVMPVAENILRGLPM